MTNEEKFWLFHELVDYIRSNSALRKLSTDEIIRKFFKFARTEFSSDDNRRKLIHKFDILPKYERGYIFDSFRYSANIGILNKDKK